MTNELFLFIILVLILLYFLPERKHTVKMRFEKRQDIRQDRREDRQDRREDRQDRREDRREDRQDRQDRQDRKEDREDRREDRQNSSTSDIEDDTDNIMDEKTNLYQEANSSIENEQLNMNILSEVENIKNKSYKKNLKGKKKLSMEVINDYLSEVKCEEGFNTMGLDMNIGNDMAFQTQQILPKNNLDKALSKSLVPDFEPSALNINQDLNSFGYATNNQSDNNFYENRGYIDPIDASQYANSVQYNLAYPYQTRYCDK